MAVIRELTDGTITISLVAIDAIHRLRGGFDGNELRQEELEERAGIGGTVVENHRLNMAIGSGDTIDDAAQQLADLTTLLRKAWMNNAKWSKVWQPVWLKEQAEGEAAPRYATLIRVAGLKFPDFLRNPFRALTYLEDWGLNLVREHPWRDSPPGALPANPLTLDDADGPASPTQVLLAAEWTDCSLTHVYAYDASLTSWSANLIAAHDTNLFPASPAVDDYVIFGFDNTAGLIGHHIAIPLKTGANWNVTLDVQRDVGAGMVAITEGSGYSRWPTGTVSQLFNAAGWWVLNILPGIGTWAATAIHGITRYWVKVKITAVTSVTSGPVLHDTNEIYAPRTPYFDIPAASTIGDAPPIFLVRITPPIGGGTLESPSNVSRILMGAKSEVKGNDLDNFQSHINLGNQGNIPAITVAAVDADTTLTASPNAPGGYLAVTTFVADVTEITRVRVTLDDLLADYVGTYQVYGVLYQSAGAVGDVSVRLRARIASTDDKYPQWNGELTALTSINTWEVVDLGRLTLPFAGVHPDDYMTSQDVYLEILAKRASGAAQLWSIALFLMPVDEWWTVLEDPVSSVSTGSSALRGDTALDVDAGVVRKRCLKYVRSGANLVPAETWVCKSFPNRLEAGTLYRLYTMPLYFPGTFGTPPMAWQPGMMMAVEVYAVDRWHTLMAVAP